MTTSPSEKWSGLQTRIEQALASLDLKVESKLTGRESLAALEAAWVLRVSAVEIQLRGEIRALESKVGDLESWQTWAIRIVLAAVILAVLGFVFSGQGGPAS